MATLVSLVKAYVRDGVGFSSGEMSYTLQRNILCILQLLSEFVFLTYVF